MINPESPNQRIEDPESTASQALSGLKSDAEFLREQLNTLEALESQEVSGSDQRSQAQEEQHSRVAVISPKRAEFENRNRLGKEFTEKQKELRDLRKEREKLLGELEKITKELDQTRAITSDVDKARRLTAELNQKAGEINNKEQAIKDVQARIKTLTGEIGKYPKDTILWDLELKREEATAPEEQEEIEKMIRAHRWEINKRRAEKIGRGAMRAGEVSGKVVGFSVGVILAEGSTAAKKSISAVWNGFLEFMDEHLEFRGKHSNLKGMWKEFTANIKEWRAGGKEKKL